MFYINNEHKENMDKIQKVYHSSEFKRFLPNSSIYLLATPEIYQEVESELNSENNPFHIFMKWDEGENKYSFSHKELTRELQSLIEIAYSLQNNHPINLDYLLVFITNENYKKVIIEAIKIHLQ